MKKIVNDNHITDVTNVYTNLEIEHRIFSM